MMMSKNRDAKFMTGAIVVVGLSFFFLTYVIISSIGTITLKRKNRGGHTWQIIQSRFVNQNDCRATNGIPTCCSSLNVTHHSNHETKTQNDDKCQIFKIYIPSEYEKLHQRMAVEINDDPEKLKSFIRSSEEIHRSVQWLERVRLRMLTFKHIPETENDRKYLSRFEMTKRCHDKKDENWTEWIEPLILQSRHPFAYLHPVDAPGYNAKLLDPDYILLASSEYKHMYNSKSSSYFIDAGASNSFAVSSQYFVCAYSQLGVHMDQIFSYEYVKHDPVVWWNSIPSHFKKHTHFINVGVSGDLESDFNPINLIKSLETSPSDFLSFKLDIDTSSIELPIFFQLLEDADAYKKVNEFIFELHYNCPIMNKDWGPKVLNIKHQLNRVDALRHFSELRKKGVRAHFWV